LTFDLWRRAQQAELDWWTELESRLQDPDFLESKRKATLAIWNGIISLGAPPDARVLEVGTGGDGFVNFIPARLCVGVEPLIARMKQKGLGLFSPAAGFVCGVGERLPFRDRSFGVVFLYNVLDHTARPAETMDEICRVLKEDGILHLLLDTYSFAFKVYRRTYRPDPMHPHTFTQREIRRWLKRRQLRIVCDVSDRRSVGKRKARAFRVFCRITR